MCAQTASALLVVLALLVVAALCFRYALPGAGRDGYLVYPYLDLDEPGERGSYYALSECAA